MVENTAARPLGRPAAAPPRVRRGVLRRSTASSRSSCGDELFTAGPGALAFAPGGVEHTLANLGDAPARYVLLCTPAGFERYFARLAAEAAGEDPPPWALAPTPPVTTLGGQIGERDDLASATPIAPAGD